MILILSVIVCIFQKPDVSNDDESSDFMKPPPPEGPPPNLGPRRPSGPIPNVVKQSISHDNSHNELLEEVQGPQSTYKALTAAGQFIILTISFFSCIVAFFDVFTKVYKDIILLKNK